MYVGAVLTATNPGYFLPQLFVFKDALFLLKSDPISFIFAPDPVETTAKNYQETNPLQLMVANF
jgi:hypothetical protein